MSYNSINLEKGMYSSANKNFSQILEELDPSENYAGTPLEGLMHSADSSKGLTLR